MDKKLIRAGEHVHSVDRRWVKRWNNLRIIKSWREVPSYPIKVKIIQFLKWVGLIMVAAGVGLALAFVFSANVRS